MVDENFNVNPLNPIDMVDGDIPFTMCSWEFNLIEGCTDESACNYDELANQDDGSCTYPDTPINLYSEIDGYAYDCDGNCLLPLEKERL